MVFSYLGDFSLDKDEKERLEKILESRGCHLSFGKAGGAQRWASTGLSMRMTKNLVPSAECVQKSE